MPGKARVAFDLRAPLRHGRAVHIVDQLHRVRVAHGQNCRVQHGLLAVRRHRQGPGGPTQGVAGLQTDCIKGQCGQLKNGRAHVHVNAAVRRHVQGEHAVEGLHAHCVALAQVLVAHIAHKAARAIAAVLYLLAVGVVNGVSKINIRAARRGGPDAKYLVRAHTEMPVGQKTVLRSRQTQQPAGFVKHHEIVAGALHFGESDSHMHIIRRPRGRG